MPNLDDLLALLPDNSTGEISAADLRAVISGIWEEGAIVAARVSALEQTGGSGTGVISITGSWGINTNPDATPGTKTVACDTGNFSTASVLKISKTDKDLTDLTAAIIGANRIFAQQKKDSTSWVDYTVTGAATDNGSWISVPVSVTSFAIGGGNPWGDAIIVFII
jgi:3D (Asp-Asp-Asp) domain-containing protein